MGREIESRQGIGLKLINYTFYTLILDAKRICPCLHITTHTQLFLKVREFPNEISCRPNEEK
jgi:hypothetical protein